MASAIRLSGWPGLAVDPAVTAVLCGNDDLALGVIRAMRQAGRPVPGDVSVVGFDDIPQAEFFTPALTTVRLDFAELGRASFAALQEQIGAALTAGPRPRPQPRPELIVRESSDSAEEVDARKEPKKKEHLVTDIRHRRHRKTVAFAVLLATATVVARWPAAAEPRHRPRPRPRPRGRSLTSPGRPCGRATP